MLCCLFAIWLQVFSQQFGGIPPAVKYNQINTKAARVIYPVQLDSSAQIIASAITTLQKDYTSLGSRLRKINIVLQPGVTVSNAYVGLAPYRSEFYLTPPQNPFELGAQSWVYNLAIHEYRHVQQYSNFNVGLSKTMSVIFGDGGQALANAASVPNWFFEGDAVYNETSLSRQGRGRLPDFFNGYKSLYFQNKDYSYMQLRNGSFRKYIPNHYELGYLLVAYGNEKYGGDFWKNVTHDAASFKPLFYPFQGAIKKQTGKSFRNFKNDAFAYYQQQWLQENNNTVETNYLTGNEKNNVVNYRYPYAAGNDVVVIKNSYKKIPAFYKITSEGKQEKIGARSISIDPYFSYNNNKIVYAAYQPDARWGNRDYSVIKLLDVPSGKETRITSHSKYFSPDISHNSQHIVAAEIIPGKQSSLVLMSDDGVLIKKWSNDSGFIFSHPKFSADDAQVFVMVRDNAGLMGIQLYDIASGNMQYILPLNNRILGFPVVHGDTLVYTASNKGRDEVWAYINSEKKHFLLASNTTGMYHGTLVNSKVVSSVFTADGYRLASTTPQWQPINVLSDTLTGLYVLKPFQNSHNNLQRSITTQNYPSKKYPKFSHPFNFYTWSPYVEHPDYSVVVYGENVLNTFQTQLAYTYNANEKYSRVGITEIYGGWFLQPFVELNEIFNRQFALSQDTVAHWNELNARSGLILPLTLTGGKYYRRLTVAASYNYNSIQYRGNTKSLFLNKEFGYVQGRLQYNTQMQTAAQHILPHLGSSILMQYRHNVSSRKAIQTLVSGSQYLPGLISTHNLVLNGAWQSRDTANNYFYTNNFPMSRGYELIDFPRMYKLGAEYHLPLFYPDWGFGNIVYFLRIRGDVFYDYTNAKSLRTGKHYQLRSYGSEIYFDTKWWNQQFITVGLRYSRLVDYSIVGLKQNQWDLVVPVSLY